MNWSGEYLPETLAGLTPARVAALVVIAVLALGLLYLRLSGGSDLSVPNGWVAGDLTMEPCSYSTEDGSVDADCGTLVVPENRNDPESRLIALPVTRIRSTSETPGDPVFRLEGGPGISNMTFPEASRLIDRHDVVLVGYRGVEGSSVLDCPEVESALKSAADFGERGSLQRSAEAFVDCAERLLGDGIDLDGYSLPQRVDDLEAVRTALGYDRINLLSYSVGTRTAMIYSWRYPEALQRSVMIAVNPPGHFFWDPETTDELLGDTRRSAPRTRTAPPAPTTSSLRCAAPPTCRAAGGSCRSKRATSRRPRSGACSRRMTKRPL